MSKRNEATLPQEWQKVKDYSLRLGWLHNKPKPSHLEMQEVLKEDGEDISLEIVGHPGWWSHAHVLMDSFELLEDALSAAKSALKNSDFKPSVLNFDAPSPGSAPFKLSKNQRIKLIDEIMHEPKEKHEGLLHEAFLQEGDYALSVWIEELSFREDFEAPFEASENPLRSFVGEIAVAHTATLVENEDEDDELDLGEFDMDDDPDMEDLSEEELVETIGALEKMKDVDEDADWQEVAKGVLKLEGNTLYVGDWKCVVPNDELIYGAAFQSASFDLKEQGLSVLVEMENSDE